MSEADLPVVMRNEKSAYTDPWRMGIFRDCLQATHYCCQTLIMRDQLIGHAVLSTGAGEAHLLNSSLFTVSEKAEFTIDTLVSVTVRKNRLLIIP